MKLLYHLVSPQDWQASQGPYRAASLDSEGFIHCSYAHQVARVANLFYGQAPALLVLCIDPGRLTCPLRDEDPGTGERFPHVYGPIERAAIIEVRALARDLAGQWQFETSLDV